MATSEFEKPSNISIKGIHGTINNDQIARLRATSKDTPLSEMRSRFDSDGYLLVKNLLPREDVLNVRQHYFQHYEDLGMLKVGTTPRDGVFDSLQKPSDHAGLGAGILPPDELIQQRMEQAHHEVTYLQLLKHPTLRQMVQGLMGWKNDVLLKRTLLRHNIPGGLSTGIHYDKLFLRGGSAYFLTAWVPLGDVSENGGGLMYLSGSKNLGREIEDEFSTRAEVLPEEERVSAFNAHMGEFGYLSVDAGSFHRESASGKGKWLISGFEAGDVVFHDPYMVHGSSRNEDVDNRIRLSTDLRFYEDGSDLDYRWHQDYWHRGDGL